MYQTSFAKVVEEQEKNRRYELKNHRHRVRTLNEVMKAVFETPLARFVDQAGVRVQFQADMTLWDPNRVYVRIRGFDLEDVLEHFCRPIHSRFQNSWTNDAKGLRWTIRAEDSTTLFIRGMFEIPTDFGYTKELHVRLDLKDVETACKIKSQTAARRDYDEVVREAVREAAERNVVTTYEIDCGELNL